MTNITYICKCGRRIRYACTEQWQIDYAQKHKLGRTCDYCLSDAAKYSKGLPRDDQKAEFEESARELEQQRKAELRCQNM